MWDHHANWTHELSQHMWNCHTSTLCLGSLYTTCKTMKGFHLMPKGESQAQPLSTNSSFTVSSLPLLTWCICCFPSAGFGAKWFWSLVFAAVWTSAAKQNKMTKKVELLSLESVSPSSYTAAGYRLWWTRHWPLTAQFSHSPKSDVLCQHFNATFHQFNLCVFCRPQSLYMLNKASYFVIE